MESLSLKLSLKSMDTVNEHASLLPSLLIDELQQESCWCCCC
jgi:hypothetical protein